MKTCAVLVLVLALSLTTGCASLFGTGSGGQQVWTYNLQQSLARSGGDVAMTMVLDQGVAKDKAVEFVNILIRIIESNVSRKEIETELDAQVALFPPIAEIVDKLKHIVPDSVVGTDKIPPAAKAILLSLLKDGALYGASLYKDENKDMKVPAATAAAPTVK